jgi:hypothetical protein
MKHVPLIVSEVKAMDGKPHYAVVVHGEGNFPIALCGMVHGTLSKESKAYAHLFADAPDMLELLNTLVEDIAGLGPEFNATNAERIKLQDIIDRAQRICARHR